MPRTSKKRAFPSPWQALVQERTELLGHTTRSLAEAISTPRRTIYNTTVWSWVRNVAGVPDAGSYTPEVNKLLASALKIPADMLATAYDQSRLCFSTGNNDASNRRMTVLRRMFSDSVRETWTKDEIVATIDQIMTM